MPLERLDKILASQNVGSRKQVGERIRHGEVAVNGTVIKRPEQKVRTIHSLYTPLKDPENLRLSSPAFPGWI